MSSPTLTWQPNWVATCFAGARVRLADGGSPAQQEREAELTILALIAQCEDGCSLGALKDRVLARLILLGYRSEIVMDWLDERSSAAWEEYRNPTPRPDPRPARGLVSTKEAHDG